MHKELIHLPFTICFCIYKDMVLMLHRKKSPNEHLWNGLGGKLEVGESPKDGVKREVMEESGINLDYADSMYFVGIVTWPAVHDEVNIKRGMYVYIAYFSQESVLFEKRETAEGVLEWKKISWVCDKNNKQVIENVPHFLPKMIEDTRPKEYTGVRENGVFVRIAEYPFI